MVKRAGLVLFFSLILGFLLIPSAMSNYSKFTSQLPSSESKIDSFLLDLYQAKEASRAPALILMAEKADLNTLITIEPLADRRMAIYKMLTEVAQKSQAPVIAELTAKGAKFRQYYIVNMIAVYDASLDMLQELAKRSDVRRIVGNPAIENALPSTLRAESQEAVRAVGGNVVRIGAEKVWTELKNRGEGITVAGQDTGYQWDHPALKAHYRGLKDDGTTENNYNWHDAIHEPMAMTQEENPCGYNSKEPCDDNEHGTHTMGTMIGDDGAGNQIGVAPGAKWMGCRNMDMGTGTPSTYIECFEYFLAPYAYGANPMTDGDPTKAPDVINNSWGCPESEGCKGDEILPAVEALTKAGVMVVVSAGNAGSGCETINDAPAHYTDDTFSVGALDHRNDKIAGFSSRGPSKFDGGVGPDVSAPGVNVRSSIPGNKYAEFGWSGTSMAGPHAVGAVALLWSAVPGLKNKVAETTAVLRAAAEPKKSAEMCGGIPGDKIPNNTYGYGLLNIYETIKKSGSL